MRWKKIFLPSLLLFVLKAQCSLMQRCFDLEVSHAKIAPAEFTSIHLAGHFLRFKQDSPDRKRNLKCSVQRQFPSKRDFLSQSTFFLLFFLGQKEKKAKNNVHVIREKGSNHLVPECSSINILHSHLFCSRAWL